MEEVKPSFSGCLKRQASGHWPCRLLDRLRVKTCSAGLPGMPIFPRCAWGWRLPVLCLWYL